MALMAAPRTPLRLLAGKARGAPLPAAKPRAKAAPPHVSSSSSRFHPRSNGAAAPLPFTCACASKNKNSAHNLFDVMPNRLRLLSCSEFSVLSPDTPWEVEDIWRTFAAYFFVLHIPLSFGGLSVIAKVLHHPVLDPLTMVVSTAMLQIAELALALVLLQYTMKPQHEVRAFFVGKYFSRKSWVKETALGIGLLLALVSLSSAITDMLVGSEDAYDHILKEILSYSPTSRLVCFVLYCVIAPLTEETIYRGFLLTALSSTMKWHHAVIISSLMFSVAHISAENFLQLFAIGCILALAYCRTGNLASSFTIHSFYNAVILLSTIMS